MPLIGRRLRAGAGSAAAADGGRAGAPSGHPAAARPAPAFRPDVEGLRAVAIGLVLLFHAEVPRLGGGLVGVDVFFVISGFLITGLLLREMERTGRISLASFYARRARRILPAAAFVSLVTVLVSWLSQPDPVRDDVGRDAAAAALQLVNWHFLTIDLDQLVPRLQDSPLIHYWSLAVEEQFYLVWPLTMIAVAAVARRRRRPWRPALTATALVASVASFAWCAWVTPQHLLLGYMGSPSRAWQFGVGALLAIGTRRIDRLPASVRGHRFRQALGWAGAAAVVSCPFWAANVVYPGVYAIVPTVGTAAIIAAGGPAPGRFTVSRLLSLRPVRFAGRLSYSWYLWHVPVTAAAAGLWGDRGWAFTLAAELAAAVPAYLTMRYVEQPFRYARVFSASPRRGLGLAAGVTVLSLAAAAAVAA